MKQYLKINQYQGCDVIRGRWGWLTYSPTHRFAYPRPSTHSAPVASRRSSGVWGGCAWLSQSSECHFQFLGENQKWCLMPSFWNSGKLCAAFSGLRRPLAAKGAELLSWLEVWQQPAVKPVAVIFKVKERGGVWSNFSKHCFFHWLFFSEVLASLHQQPQYSEWCRNLPPPTLLLFGAVACHLECSDGGGCFKHPSQVWWWRVVTTF